MSKFNFDSEFFRRIISKCEKTEKIYSLSVMIKEAVEMFYDEYDYYPELAVYAPGTFTIMGDHLDYVNGNLVQAALPLGAVVVGKSLCSVKCKLYTSSRNVEGLRKSVFPISHYKKNLKVFPEWVNYIKGVINCFPYEEIKGFDAVIHSNVPVKQGYGSSAALQVGFFTFLEAVVGKKTCEMKEAKGYFCHQSEMQLQFREKKLGQYSNFTSAVALPNSGVRVNCRTKNVSVFEMKDLNILFLLTYPKFEIELNDRDYVDKRKMELYVAAKLLGLDEIIDATQHHLTVVTPEHCVLTDKGKKLNRRCLQHLRFSFFFVLMMSTATEVEKTLVLENMEDPSKAEVIAILRGLDIDDNTINEFVEELFNLPKSESIPEDMLYSEDYYGIGGDDIFAGEYEKSAQGESVEEAEEQDVVNPCIKAQEIQRKLTAKPPPVSYIQQRIAELCFGKISSQPTLPQRVCEEINCLGGLDNLSADSGLTVCGKLLRRVRHVVSENVRSLTFSDLISQLDYEELGTMLIQSHLSLKLDFEVSCPTLDTLVQLAIDSDRVYGAKMMSGGGTLTLLHRSVVEKFIEKIKEKFEEDFQFYLVFPSSGARILNLGVKTNPKSTLSDVLLNRDQLLKKAIENFELNYKYRPTHGAYSAGVLNLIGDFTDFNHGFCLSMGLSMMTVVVGALNGTSKIRAITTEEAEGERQKVIFSALEMKELKFKKNKWAKILIGVASYFKGSVKGLDCLIETTLPCDTGVSHKSAMATAFYTFLEELHDEKTTSMADKAHRSMLAVQESTCTVHSIGEHVVAAKSKENFLVLVDCRTTSSTLIPFQDPSVTFLITFVGVEAQLNRALLYTRMEECYQVAKALGGKSLRCLTLKDLDALKYASKKIPEKSVRRAVHVITENERVLKAAEALKNHDYDSFGELMTASHNSLRDNYEITTPEFDRLVASAMEVDGVMGCKMPCSGFTTCIVSLVKRWAMDDLIEYLQKSCLYKLTSYVVNPVDGCGPLDLKEQLDKLPSPQFTFEHIFPF